MKFENIVFLRVEDVDSAHAIGLREEGGLAGARDLGLIESATMAPQSGYYGSLAEMAAVYAHGLCKNHGYLDGNKRTAALVAYKFLVANGIEIEFSVEPWSRYFEELAHDQISREGLADLLTGLMGEDPVLIEE